VRSPRPSYSASLSRIIFSKSEVFRGERLISYSQKIIFEGVKIISEGIKTASYALKSIPPTVKIIFLAVRSLS